MKTSLVAILALICAPAFADETRSLAAHEHGVGALNIAVSGDTVAMEFHAPGADLVGFEYEAKSAEDRAAIDNAVATLAKPLDLFVLPAAAECSVLKASASLESEEAHNDHDEHKKDDDDHDHDEHAKDEKHEDHDHDEHAKDEHDHDEHAEESHTEFHAEYTLACGNLEALTAIDFAYFTAFENAREIHVQIVTASGAQAFEVERDAPKLDLGGMF